jgi:iron complex outermembrane receptor protein
VTTSQAAYLNATYAITPRLNASVGVRYSDEHKDYDRSTSTFYSNPLFNSTFAFSVAHDWTDTSPMISLDYHVTDDVMLYARASRGFKAGGFNGRSNNAGEEAPYDPETLTSYEVGARSSWLDGRLTANLSVFTNTYEDFQARVSDVVHDPITDIDVPAITVVNAGQLDINGAELELAFNPFEALHLDAQIGYLDASYGEFHDARFTSFGGSRAFQTPAFSPEWTARYGASYDFELGAGGTLTLAASARFRSRMALAVDNTPVNSNVELPGMFQDDYWLYDASATWRANDVLSIALVGRNLSDEVYKTDAQEFSSVGNIRTAYYGAPQTVALVVTAHY